jgi:hypothetical protein
MTETDPISETLCSLVYQAMNKVQKLSNASVYTPTSESIRTDLKYLFFKKIEGRFTGVY